MGRKLWTIVQLSLVGAAYRFHTFNSHVKVFCTIRQEAFVELWNYDATPGQIRGYAIEISYTYEDFREIFVKNIELMQKADLAIPDAHDPMERFFGSFHNAIRHKFAPQYESCFNHLLRHTFYRPRDLMLLGSAVCRIPVKLRVAEELKRVVRRTSDRVVEDFVSDMKHFFILPSRRKLFPLIERNNLTREQLKKIQEQYLGRSDFDRSSENLSEHPFCVWFKLGFLGYIRAEDAADSVSYRAKIY